LLAAALAVALLKTLVVEVLAAIDTLRQQQLLLGLLTLLQLAEEALVVRLT
jgi:hypothetical protein